MGGGDFRVLLITLGHIRLGYIGLWVALQGKRTAGIGPARVRNRKKYRGKAGCGIKVPKIETLTISMGVL